jgi:outer membrane protein TolC
LRQLIGADLTAALRSTEIVLDDDPTVAPSQSTILPFEEALSKAIQARPEARAAEQRISVDELNARVARDSLLPRLDLSLQGGATGPGFNQILSSDGTNPSLPMPYPGLGETLRQVVGFNYPSYGVGLQLTFPLRNSTAKAALADSLVGRAKDRYQQRQVKEQIVLDVRQALTSIELANASIEAAIHARDLARLNVQAEQQKYQLGSITSFEVLDSQSRLASTESALLSAYVGYQEAYIGYQRATWTLLDGMGMIVEHPHVR